MKAFSAGMALLLISVLVGCSEEPRSGASTSDFAKEREKLASRVAAGKKPASRRVVTAAMETGETGFVAMDADFYYDSTARHDPFRSFRFKDGPASANEAVRGPLEQFEVGQLAVVGVVWSSGRPRAMVEDPGGQTYIVREGSHVGKNEGRVIHIGDNLVLVKETYVDFAGEQSTKDVELRIRKSQGG